jgi:ribosomal protein L28
LHKTRRRWQPNVRKVTIMEDGRTKKVVICTRCLRTRNKTSGK